MQPDGDNYSTQFVIIPFLIVIAIGLLVAESILNGYWKCRMTLYRCTCGHLRILHKEREFKSTTDEDFNYLECTDNSCSSYCRKYEEM